MAKRRFRWTRKRELAAELLSYGHTYTRVAAEVGVERRTLYRWRQVPEFAEEVDRLTLMTGIACKAERIRIAKRAVGQLVTEAGVKTDRDLLSWLEFAQKETDGIKLNITTLLDEALALAGGGSEGDSGADQG